MSTSSSSALPIPVLALALGLGSPGARAQNPEAGREQRIENAEPPKTSATPGYWCPMHPSVRSALAGVKCGDCGMALVAIPDRSSATYWLDVSAQPPALPAGRPVRLRLVVRDRETNAAVSAFEQIHERPMHLFLVSSDLQHFDHVHPTASEDGAFEIPIALPKPGAYRLVADVLPTGATPQTLQHTLLTSGQTMAPARPRAAPAVEVLEATDGGVRARLSTRDSRVGGDAHVLLELADSATGRSVTDLEPYLGAWGHMFLASDDLADVAHSHPLLEETQAGGPAITFQTLFARPGWYRVWTQVQRRGRLLTFGFTVRVAAAL